MEQLLHLIIVLLLAVSNPAVPVSFRTEAITLAQTILNSSSTSEIFNGNSGSIPSPVALPVPTTISQPTTETPQPSMLTPTTTATTSIAVPPPPPPPTCTLSVVPGHVPQSYEITWTTKNAVSIDYYGGATFYGNPTPVDSGSRSTSERDNKIIVYGLGGEVTCSADATSTPTE